MRLFPALAVACAVVLSIGVAGSADAAPHVSAKTFQNCTQLNKTFPHGVGKKGARDHTSGTPVRNFTVNNSVYAANTKSDRDKDGIACEKR